MRKHISCSRHLKLCVHELAQLFSSMEPMAFHGKALDRNAETFIEA